MKIFSISLAVILILFGISFAVLNSETVSFNYYIGEAKLPLVVLLVCSFILGAVSGLVIGYMNCKYKNRLAAKSKK